jgi:hypothetical protein
MNALPIHSPGYELLAGNVLLESISRALNAGPQAKETLLFVAGAVALVLLILLSARFFGREPREEREPRVDYLTLGVDVLGLSESDRRDLRRIARRAELEYPLAMLLSPANLARAAATTFGAERDEDLRARMEQLCVRLFDSSLPAPGPGRRG